MKKILVILAMVASAAVMMAQDENTATSIQKTDSILENINAWLEQIELDLSLKQRFRLYPTENMYTFLRLDTKTGKIDKVQWNLDTNKEFITSINSSDLSYGEGYGSNSFELCPTQNMYQFILIDKTDGRTWHVQWGMNASERWIRRIY